MSKARREHFDESITNCSAGIHSTEGETDRGRKEQLQVIKLKFPEVTNILFRERFIQIL